MRNQPQYHIVRNTRYALAGLKDVLLNETSFKLELIIVFLLLIGLIFAPIELAYKMILGVSLFIPIITELINSAIERAVDLVTLKHHKMAKRAKDLGSSAVFVSILMTTAIWISVFILILTEKKIL